jgi:predicted membrane protein
MAVTTVLKCLIALSSIQDYCHQLEMSLFDRCLILSWAELHLNFYTTEKINSFLLCFDTVSVFEIVYTIK